MKSRFLIQAEPNGINALNLGYVFLKCTALEGAAVWSRDQFLRHSLDSQVLDR